ncbi:glucose 1-dehydrogenase [Alteribacter natronophilus]|uniref:glucose 1-dehydrogenase n=1 Tax=Alteribacter natronophilus TaxID=2583810 RepID=UPI00110F171E|nr:glucose 1-dehydrogenase [Alteribacter natronophilus]TMW72438.1 SDR family oxidoreductase [Alteribacter natronophilus]
MTFSKRTVVITGGANGIGAALAEGYGKEGANVVIADIDEQNGRQTAAGILRENGSATFFKIDVSREDEVKALVKHTEEKYGAIEILINNAGVSEFHPAFDFSAEDWDRILGTNLKGVFLCTREAARSMEKQGIHGSIVNIASTRALMSEPDSEAYAASKGGILGLTHSFAASLAKYRIRVNAVSPGWIHTGDEKELRHVDHSQHLSGRVGKPRDILKACFYLTDPENDFINGENIIVDGGMTRKMMYEH